MRKLLCALLALGLLAAWAPARAEATGLVIDTTHVFEGMNAPYARGYVPDTRGGRALILLPLLGRGDRAPAGPLTASLSLGDPANSPFVHANYEMDVPLQDHPADGGKSTVSCYLVRFDVPLASRRVMGTYPVTVRVRWTTAGGEEASQEFSLYVTITDGIDPHATPAPEPRPEEPAPRPQPKIIVSQYATDPAPVVAGKDFDVTVTLTNTQKTWHAKNIVVTWAGDGTDVLPRGGSHTRFIEEIENGESITLRLPMTARSDAQPGARPMTLTVSYEDSAGSAYTVDADLWIDLRQPLRLVLDEPVVPETVHAGDSLPITLQVFNMGKSTVYNVLCTLALPGATPEGSAYLGNIGPGTAALAEIYAFFGMIDEEEGRAAYGPTRGTLTVTYEDEDGQTHTQTADVATVIGQPLFSSAARAEEPQARPVETGPWWASIFVLAGLGMMVYAALSYRRKLNRLRREYGDENL